MAYFLFVETDGKALEELGNVLGDNLSSLPPTAVATMAPTCRLAILGRRSTLARSSTSISSTTVARSLKSLRDLSHFFSFFFKGAEPMC